MKRFITLFILAGFISGLSAGDPPTLAIGSRAPDFSLTGIDGKIYSLESFSSTEVLTIIFTANHCPTAQAYEDRINKLSESYEPEEMMIVAISSNHPMAVCIEELGYSDLGDAFEEMKIRAADKEVPEKEDKVLGFLKQNQAAFSNYLSVETDRDAFADALYPEWQGNLPLTLLVAPGGELVYVHDGIIDPLEVKKAIIGKLGRYFADD